MGINQINCKCSKLCREGNYEEDLTKENPLKNNIINYRFNSIVPKSINTIHIFENIITDASKNNESEKDTIIYKNEIIETFRKKTKEEELNIEKFKSNNDKNLSKMKNVDNIQKNELNLTQNSSEKIIPLTSIDEIKEEKVIILKNHQKNVFYTETLIEAEKNFEDKLDYKKDWNKYNEAKIEELRILNLVNNIKGFSKTPDEGEVIKFKGQIFLYKGELDLENLPNGKGVLYSLKGEKYEGNFIKGELYGLGRFIDKNGTCYEGIFKNGKIVSKALMIKFNEKNLKVIYKGELKNYKEDGWGEEEISGEYLYVGQFLNGKKHGKGKLKYLYSNEYYEGEFKNDKIDGKGIYEFNNKEIYKGNFVEGVKHGKGQYIWIDGSNYDGDYNNGIREGHGIYKWSDGRIFEGQFKDGKPYGVGLITYKGKKINCKYINGKPVHIKNYSCKFKN